MAPPSVPSCEGEAPCWSSALRGMAAVTSGRQETWFLRCSPNTAASTGGGGWHVAACSAAACLSASRTTQHTALSPLDPASGEGGVLVLPSLPAGAFQARSGPAAAGGSVASGLALLGLQLRLLLVSASFLSEQPELNSASRVGLELPQASIPIASAWSSPLPGSPASRRCPNTLPALISRASDPAADPSGRHNRRHRKRLRAGHLARAAAGQGRRGGREARSPPAPHAAAGAGVIGAGGGGGGAGTRRLLRLGQRVPPAPPPRHRQPSQRPRQVSGAAQLRAAACCAVNGGVAVWLRGAS